MSGSRALVFSDPYPYEGAIRGARLEVLVSVKGDFHAELTQIELHRLWLHCARETLPRLLCGTVSQERAAIGFLIDANQPGMHHCGIPVSPDDIVMNDWDSMHRRTVGPCRWAGMSLTPADFAAAGTAIAGCELSVPLHTRIVRPSAAPMSRLKGLHAQARQLAKTAPDKLSH